jgi:hypothetical protein
MRVHRGYLFWGIFFVLLGGIPLAERAGLIDVSGLGEIGRLWPVVLIAIGVSIVLARSGIAMLGTVIAALVLGALAGAALASGGGWVGGFGECVTDGGGELTRTTDSGTFTGGAHVELQLSCGALDVQAGVTSANSTSWSLAARHRGSPPIVSSTPTSLTVRTAEGEERRQEWTLFLPGPDLDSIAVDTNAASATLDVSGTDLTDLAVSVNAGDVRLLAADAAIAELDVQVNAGRMRVTLGGDTAGSLSVNAGAIDLCVPPTAELRIDLGDDLLFVTNLADRGLVLDGDTWERPGTGGPVIELGVEGNVGSFTLDPAGGCG